MIACGSTDSGIGVAGSTVIVAVTTLFAASRIVISTSVAACGVTTARSVKRPCASIVVGLGTTFGWLDTTVYGPTPPVIVNVTGVFAATRIVLGDTDSPIGLIVTVAVTCVPAASRAVRV